VINEVSSDSEGLTPSCGSKLPVSAVEVLSHQSWVQQYLLVLCTATNMHPQYSLQ
jgi:hypothetical protein